MGRLTFDNIGLLTQYGLLLLIRSTLKAMQHVEGNILARFGL